MKSVKLNTTSGSEKGCGVIALSGHLTLDCVEQILKHFRAATKKYADLEVHATSVSAIDLGFLQLLYSLEQFQLARKKAFEVHLELDFEQAQLLQNTGFGKWVKEAVSRTSI